jgi:putative ABC transport system permease protein
MTNLRLAVRALRARPLYATSSICIVAFGLAAVVTVFTFVDGLLLRPLRVTEPGRLLRVWKVDPVRGFDHYTPVYPEIVEWARRASTATLESVAVIGSWGPWDGILSGKGESERIRIELVSSNFFDVLGVDARYGRTFRPADDFAVALPPLVISHGYWARRFGADPELVGKTLRLAFQRKGAYEVVGVLPEGFDLATGADVWAPALAVHPEWASGQGCECDAIVRTATGITRERAEAELQAIHDRMASESPEDYRAMRVSARPLLETVAGKAGPAALLLLGACLVLAALAAVNLAGLSLAESTRRRRHLALHLALGANRGQLVRQRLTEGMMLALLGLGLGLGLAAMAVKSILLWRGVEIPRHGDIDFGPRSMVFALLVVVLTSLVSALYPAVSATGGNLAIRLRARVVGRTDRFAAALAVTAQVALAVVLLAGAGLLLRTFVEERSIDRGLRSEGLLSVGIELPDTRYSSPQARLSFINELTSRLETLPFVVAVTPMFMAPGSGTAGYSGSFVFDGQTLEEARSNPMANFEWVTPNHFRTLGIPILRGRPFEDRELSGGERVVIVSKAAADAHWPGEDPIGKTVRWQRGPLHRVVGVVSDLRYRELTRNWQSVYFPLGENPFSDDDAIHPFGVPHLLAVRTSGPPNAVIPSIRSTMARLEPDAPRDEIATMDSLFERELSAPKLQASLFTLFALVALLLAAVGLYSLFASSVAERLPEMGLRLALGATPARLLAMVWKQTARLAAAGVVAGLALAFVLSRLVERYLYGVPATDPWTYAGVALLLGGIALVATYAPARRAGRADPLSLLRIE